MTSRSSRGPRLLQAVPLALLLACGANTAGPSGAGDGSDNPDVPSQPGQPMADTPNQPSQPADHGPGKVVQPARSAADDAAFSALSAKVKSAEQLDRAGALAAYPTKFRTALTYDPNAAEFLDKIANSAVGLSDGERKVLAKNGFVISQRREFGTFMRGLAEIYAEHLPLYVTADALLESVHSSYDQMLIKVEQRMLVSELKLLLRGMRQRLQTIETSDETRADADLYLTVAQSLLDDVFVQPNAGADAAEVKKLLKLAKEAGGVTDVSLFGAERTEDFSQFTPRGHYVEDPQLSAYFRAQMWLGRTDFRLLETKPDGSQVFRRPQYLATLLIAKLVGPELARFERIDNAIRTFVGESDYMVVPEVAKLVTDLGGDAAALTAKDDAVVAAIVTGGYGKQQISSHFMVNDGQVKTLPLNRSFAFLGQRYVVDSHVFSEVVYDRLEAMRMMPSPLDAAFAALGNAQALALHPELEKFSVLSGALSRTRVLVDAHDEAFWKQNFYNLWLGSLRTLSPAPDLTNDTSGLPEVATTEAWGRRLLNAQLGSWAELRHDTLLYAKQSYTGVPGCEFPDVYVDPYPAFYESLHAYAMSGSRMVELLSDADPAVAESMSAYFALLASTTAQLKDMAERELRGEPFSEAQLAFINEAVRIERKAVGCYSAEVPDGWYAKLFFDPAKSIEFEPTIADVHTQPADESGNIVGRVLHVGTSYPRLLVTTIDTCNGPRAYAGVVYAYHEVVTENFVRETDQTWAARLSDTGSPRPSEVAWLGGLLSK